MATSWRIENERFQQSTDALWNDSVSFEWNDGGYWNTSPWTIKTNTKANSTDNWTAKTNTKANSTDNWTVKTNTKPTISTET